MSPLSLSQPSNDIEFLITRIAQSGCQFVRNGNVYPANEAAEHLRRKRASVRSALTPDQFIEHIASKSSMSGEPYLIRCTGQHDEPSGPWLRRALQERTG
ncbi:MAG: DUF5329 family protein [Burkholderiales bacterium]